ncbi:MAG: hypothetical protein QXV08_08550 [Desulfurococcus sp.]|uniref:hypothetical protein n=1 Tax=Desulfurococcus sp. TaxID=51678 RepID=UPI00317A9C8D
MTTDERYSVDELRFYLVELELHSIMWFSTIAQPHLSTFIQTPLPLVHNYPLILALQGHIVEGSYISRYNEYKRVEPPAAMFSEALVYAYPMLLDRVFYKKLLLSMSESDYLVYKPQTRLSIPLMATYNAFAPGTRGRTVIVVTRDRKLPEEFYLRLGAKRYGVWKAVYVREAHVEVVNRSVEVSSPFNVADVSPETLKSSLVVLRHYAGDIALSGVFTRALDIRVNGERILKPIPFFISV